MLVFSVVVAARAQPPSQHPFLVVEPGMHTGVIRKLDVSADGTLIATASEDKTARLWSVPESRLLGTFRLPMSEGEGGRAYAVALSPDGRLLAAGGLDADQETNHQGSYVYVFDTLSGRILHRLGPVPQAIYDLDFSGDGKRLAAGLGQGGGVFLWQAPFTGPFHHATDYAGSINDLEFDGEDTLYVAADDGTLSTYGPGFTPKLRFPLPDGAVAQSLSVTLDGHRMALGYQDQAGIDIVSLPQFELLHRVDTGFVTRGDLAMVAWSGDGQTLYASGSFFINGPDPFLIFAFGDEGRGTPRQIGDTMGNVLDMASLSDGGAIFSTALPSVGVLGKPPLFFGPVTANMTEKLGDNFQVSADGSATHFGLGVGAEDPWLFDAKALTFTRAATVPAGFVSPDTTALPVAGWEDTQTPNVAGVALPLTAGDTSHALAIAPNAKSLVLGTGWSLTRFDPQGGIFWKARTHGTCWGVNISGDGQLVVAAFDDGTLRWYRTSDGRELLALFVHVPSKRWIAWTPSGYYAASPGAEDLIGWHVNGKTWNDTPSFYPASRFRDRFYRPDVVQMVLDVKDEATAVTEADALAGRRALQGSVEELLPASIELLIGARQIATSTPEVSVSYRLTSPTGREVSRVEARIDGRPVNTRGMSQVQSAYPLDEELSITITVPSRNSELSLIAYTGDQPGVAATIPVVWKGTAAAAEKPNLHALLIGISSYADPHMRLNYAAKDAADLAGKLQAQQGIFYGKVDIVTLLDADAEKNAVEKQLVQLKKRAVPEDTVLVFFAGHGMTDAAYDFYFLAADSEMDADLLAATAVDGKLIRKILGSLPGRVVLMMDTCRSGAGIEGIVDMSRTANDMAQDTAGIVMFASSQGREDSLESADWQNGAFTEALLSILDDPDVYGGDSRLSIPELEEAITVRVSDLTAGRQNAGMTKYGSSPRFFIAAVK